MNFKSFGLILVFCTFFISMMNAQTANEETAVVEVINKFFKAMELGDSAMLHSTMLDPMTSATIYRDKTGSMQIHRDTSAIGFLIQVGTPHKEVWHEEIWNNKGQIDGDFAQLWCDYAFYVDKTFSHCGVDAFQLVKQKDGWKVFHIADTRRRQGCNIPQNIQDKYK